MPTEDAYSTVRYALTSRLDRPDAWLGIILMSLATVLIVVEVSRRVRLVDIRPAIFTGWTVSALLLMIYIKIFPSLHDDEPTWHSLAMNAAAYFSGEAQSPVGLREGREGYTWISGAIYWLMGPTPMLLIILNFFALGIWVCAIAKTAELLVEKFVLSEFVAKRVVSLSAWLMVLVPGVLIWVPQILRETLAGMLVGIVCLGAVGFTTTSKKVFPLMAIAAVACLYWIRATMGIGTFAALVMVILLTVPMRGRFTTAKRTVLVAVAAVAAAAAVGRIEVLTRLDPEQRSAEMAYLVRTANSAYADPTAYGESPYSAMLILNLPRTVFGPFPWEVSISPVMLLSVAEASAWWVALIAVAWCCLRGRRLEWLNRREAEKCFMVLMVIAGALVIVYALGVANYGMLARLRPIAYSCLVPVLGMMLAGAPRRGGVVFKSKMRELHE